MAEDINVTMAEMRRDMNYILGDVRDLKLAFTSSLLPRKEYEADRKAIDKEISDIKAVLVESAKSKNSYVDIILKAVLVAGLGLVLIRQ